MDQWIKTIETSLFKLEGYIQSTGLKGYDPYDALNSPFLRILSFNNRILRLIYTQSLKRFPLNLRPLLGIQKEINPKGMGLFLAAYTKLYKIYPNTEYEIKINEIIQIIKKFKSDGYHGICWGYNFDWQSETELTKKFTPTIVNTVFVAHALLDTYELFKDTSLLRMAQSACDFILNDLFILYSDRGLCFSYTPLAPSKIHNANVLGASLLARVYSYTENKKLKEYAMKAIQYTMDYQNRDGSWYYGVTQNDEGYWKKGCKEAEILPDKEKSGFVQYIDGYHTGFVLDSLCDYMTFLDDNSIYAQIKKGLAFYANHFFLKDGTPKYFYNKVHPVDIHSIQALITFSKLIRIEKYDDLMYNISKWFLENMQNRSGYFYYRKGRLYKNKIPYIRWAQAWAFHALTNYFEFLSSSGDM